MKSKTPAQPDSAKSTVASRSEEVTRVLREMITQGDFPAGFHLQEIPLAEKMGVSRTPIREALATLAKEGLLEPGPKRGYKIRTFTIKEIVDAYEMRASLEGTACRLLAETGLSGSAIGEIRDILDFGDQILKAEGFSSKDHDRWGEMNAAFHLRLVEATGNTLLKTLIDYVYRVPLTGPWDAHWYRTEQENFFVAQRSHLDHHEIFSAIVARQSTRAEGRMREHIYNALDQVRKRYRNQTIGFDAVPFVQLRQRDLTR